jgi:hypothetical protein
MKETGNEQGKPIREARGEVHSTNRQIPEPLRTKAKGIADRRKAIEMKRRGFLGFLGGAAVAGPGMVKTAAASMSDMHLPGINALATGSGISGGIETAGMPYDDPSHQIERMARWNLARLNPDWIRRKKQERWVDGLDPDLATYRSFSIGAKVRMQRERNFDRWVKGQTNWFERALSGERDDF